MTKTITVNATDRGVSKRGQMSNIKTNTDDCLGIFAYSGEHLCD